MRARRHAPSVVLAVVLVLVVGVALARRLEPLRLVGEALALLQHDLAERVQRVELVRALDCRKVLVKGHVCCYAK